MIHPNTARNSIFKITDANRAIIVISLCAAFFFYKYILQNFPSVMAPQLMESFNLKGLGLGVLSGVYFWTYLIVPLFVGVILDYYRRHRQPLDLKLIIIARYLHVFPLNHNLFHQDTRVF